MNNKEELEKQAFEAKLDKLLDDIEVDLEDTYKMIKKGGYLLYIGIGEKDTKDLKQIFGRGQNYGKWDEPVLEQFKNEFEKAGFKVVFAKGYEYNEYYASYEDLNTFLQGVPIFEDYDSEKDKIYLWQYVKKFQTEKGINLPRHRIVFVVKKHS